MIKLFLSAASLAIISSSVLAAELHSTTAPAVVLPPPMWTGFYVGLNAGYGSGTNSNSITNLLGISTWNEFSFGEYRGFDNIPVLSSSLGPTRNPNTQSGFVGGAQFGYNYQWRNNFIIGFEADIQGSTTSGGSTGYSTYGGSSSTSIYNVYTSTWTGSQSGFGTTRVRAGINYLGTARGRIGYLITPALLAYCTGGLAYGGSWANVSNNNIVNTIISYQTNIPNALPYSDLPATQGFIGSSSVNTLLVGYSVGGGFEWMFMPHWSFMSEAIYYNLGNLTVKTSAVAPSVMGPSTYATNGFISTAAINSNTTVDYQGILARAGINYHFNWSLASIVTSN